MHYTRLHQVGLSYCSDHTSMSSELQKVYYTIIHSKNVINTATLVIAFCFVLFYRALSRLSHLFFVSFFSLCHCIKIVLKLEIDRCSTKRI